MIAQFLFWYTSIECCGYWLQNEGVALALIASVAAVVWTGGLVAYQLKEYGLTRNFALDAVQNAFMLAIGSTFMQPLTYRYVVSAFFLYYVTQSTLLLYRNRNTDWVDDKQRAKYPSLTPEQWEQVARDYRNHSRYTLALTAFYVIIIIYPYQIAVAWVATGYLFAGYQTLLWHLNTAKDKRDFEIAQLEALGKNGGQLAIANTSLAKQSEITQAELEILATIRSESAAANRGVALVVDRLSDLIDELRESR